jgi:dTMP kinase
LNSPTAKAGSLVVFEGPDGVGKTTLARRAREALVRHGIPCVVESFPGTEAGTVGRLVYDLHHDSAKFGISTLTPASRQALHIAAHLDTLERHVITRLIAGTHVLLDRYWWSTWVYGTVAHVDSQLLRHLIEAELVAWRGLRPLVIFLIERRSPGELGEEHAGARDEIVAEYRILFDEERARGNTILIVNDQPPEQTAQQIVNEILTRLSPSGDLEKGK